MTTRIISSSLSEAETSSTTTTATTTTSNGTTIIREEASTKSKLKSKSKSFNYVICDDPNNHSPFVNPTKIISQESNSCSSSSVNKNKNKSNNGSSTSSLSSLSSLSSSSSSSLSTSSSYWSWSSSSSRSWPKRSTTPTWILRMNELLDNIFVSWWLLYVLELWATKIPLKNKRSIIFFLWKYYVYIHTLVVCNIMGFYNSNSDNISDEYKALSTILYPGQFFQVTIPRMRFALGELNAVSLNEIPTENFIERIEYKMYTSNSNNDKNDNDNMIPESQRDHCTVRGLYVRNPEVATTNENNKEMKVKTKKVLFWIYGGAYLAGDAEGNISLANEFIKDCNADSVFIPSYRLAPESNIDGVLWDVCLSYKFLLQKLQKEQEAKQQQGDEQEEETIEIVFIGISSGGALGLRLLQLIRDRTSCSGSSKEEEKKKPLIPSFLEPLIDDIIIGMQTTIVKIDIVGAVLFGPYIDYRNPLPKSDQSFIQNAQYDYIVNEAVQYWCLPYLDGFIPPTNEDYENHKNNESNNNNDNNNANGRVVYSPITHDMNDLPPLCLIVSEHEVTYDMTIEIVNMVRRLEKKDKTAPSDITIGIWKHMCHVFSMLQAFVPEGKSSIQFAKEWIRTKTN
jgi:acetyl esterase/lipase